MLKKRDFGYFLLHNFGFNLLNYYSIPNYILRVYLFPNKQLVLFSKKPTALMILGKNVNFFLYRKNALRAVLSLRDLSHLVDDTACLNGPLAFPAYVHISVDVALFDSTAKKPKNFIYGLEGLGIYSRKQLNDFIRVEFFKALETYHTQHINAFFVDYLFFRKKLKV